MGKWVTINGNHVWIEEGQKPMNAFIRQEIKNKKQYGRISLKNLKEKAERINYFTKNNVYISEGLDGVDVAINGEYQAELIKGVDKNNVVKLFTNKEAMNLLDIKFSDDLDKAFEERRKKHLK